jgi:lysophospholipase L1-like esterase
MIDRCRHHGVKNIILNSNHPTTRTHTVLPNSQETYECRNIQYNEAVRLIGNNASDIHFFDVNKLFLEKVDKTDLKNYLLEDEIHLSEKGHEFYYVHFYKFLTQILETQMK